MTIETKEAIASTLMRCAMHVSETIADEFRNDELEVMYKTDFPEGDNICRLHIVYTKDVISYPNYIDGYIESYWDEAVEDDAYSHFDITKPEESLNKIMTLLSELQSEYNANTNERH